MCVCVYLCLLGFFSWIFIGKDYAIHIKYFLYLFVYIDSTRYTEMMKSWRWLRILHMNIYKSVWTFRVCTHTCIRKKSINISQQFGHDNDDEAKRMCRQFTHFLSLCNVRVMSTWQKIPLSHTLSLSLFAAIFCYASDNNNVKKFTIIFHVSRFINQFFYILFCYFVLLFHRVLFCWCGAG